MASSSQDLFLLGNHCVYPGCNKLDFLPFTCRKCDGTYCVDHRAERNHNCVNESLGDIQIPICPLCMQHVQRTQKQSANDQVEAHIVSGCKDLVVPAKKKKLNKCSYNSCSHRELVPFVCPSCKRDYCIKHRLEREHSCTVIVH